MTADNYHLKWDSHLTYLNTAVATLYKNEKFADVVLYSSNSGGIGGAMEGVGISAHKFILSSCSQFFASMFEATPISVSNTAVTYVVLPPDLSYRAIQILVQYMYSGEATVSNDILSEVLRGGEMLKIRGLCRTSSATLHHSNSQHQVTSSSHYGSSRSLSSNAQHHHGQMTGELFPASTKSSSTRFSIEQHQQQFRGLGASVMPKDSPVIIKSPKVHATNSSNSHHKHFMAPSAAVGAITINKEVAIDPEDKCCYVPAGKHHETPQMSNTFAAGNAICNELGCTNCPLSTEPASRQRSSLERHEYEEHAVTPEQHAEEIPLRYETNLRRSSHHDERQYFFTDSYEHAASTSSHHDVNQFVNVVAAASHLPSPPTPPPANAAAPPSTTNSHGYLAIKQEPTDWSGSSPQQQQHHDNSSLQNRGNLSPKQPLDFKIPLGNANVKLETEISNSHSDANAENATTSNYVVNSGFDNYNNNMHCDVCKKSFDEPKLWLRHMETHTAQASSSTTSVITPARNALMPAENDMDNISKSYVPKKRRRISQGNNGDHVTLQCDLCSTSFETPAEWVRHMNSQHTEIELAMYNNKKEEEQIKNNNTATAASSSNSASHASSNHKKHSNRSSSSTRRHHHHNHHAESSQLSTALIGSNTARSEVVTRNSPNAGNSAQTTSA